MDGMIVMAVLVGLAMIGGLATLFVALVLPSFRGAGGGWKRLAERHRAAAPPDGREFPGETVRVGAVNYKNCITVRVCPAGLYLAPGSNPFVRRLAPLLIPWSEIRSSHPTRLFWKSAHVLTVGDTGTVTVFDEVMKAAKGHLESRT